MAYRQPEPLRGKQHVDAFESGNQELDVWLRRFARRSEAAGTSRTYVTTSGPSTVVGYYALAAGAIGARDATRRLLIGQPAERPIPVVLLARLAVDKRHQGQGLGRSLLLHALLNTEIASEPVGIRALAVHAISPEARAFYERFGFEPSPSDPLHLVLLMKDLRKLLRDIGLP